MLKFDLERLFKIRAVNKRLAYLYKNGFTYGEAQRLVSGKISRLPISHIEKLCVLFKCSPSELFTYVPNESANLPEDHPLNSLVREETAPLSELLEDLPIDVVNCLIPEIKKLKDSVKKL